MKNFSEKWVYRSTLVLFIIAIIVLIIVAVINLFDYYFYEESIITASGRQNLGFSVFYLDNTFFGENPISRDFDFLMSFTDYIVINNGFTASFSHETDIFYSYSSEKRFIIQPVGIADSNRFVYQTIFPMSDFSGQIIANRINFEAENDGNPGGVYTISPNEYIMLFYDFVENQTRQMESENVVAQGLRSFSAELHINFTYTIRIPEFGLNETITRGYRLPLTSEVFTLTATGTSNFEWQHSVSDRDVEITMLMIIFLVTGLAISLFGLLYCIKKLSTDPNVYRREKDEILKKYSNEVVVYNKPINLSRYEPMVVNEFSELLKLTINLNKHIMCYVDEEHAAFVVIIDEFACIYRINFYGRYGNRLNHEARF